MSEEIIKVLDELGKRFGIAIDWTSENVLPYAEELAKKFVNYEVATSILWVVFVMIAFAISLPIAIKMYKKADDDGWYSEGLCVLTVLCILVSIALGITAFVLFINQGIDIVTCLTFPEKAIFEYLSTIAV